MIETTIQSPGRRGSDSDDGADLSVPGAPKNNHQPLPGERMDVTEMVSHNFMQTASLSLNVKAGIFNLFCHKCIYVLCLLSDSFDNVSDRNHLIVLLTQTDVQ